MTSRALPKACSEYFAPRWLFRGRQEYEPAFRSASGTPKYRSATGFTISSSHVSMRGMMGQASVTLDFSPTAPLLKVTTLLPAVVLKPDARADEKAIRSFAAERLADFKVPRQVLIMDELPKGATGKVQRIGLAQKLGLAK